MSIGPWDWRPRHPHLMKRGYGHHGIELKREGRNEEERTDKYEQSWKETTHTKYIQLFFMVQNPEKLHTPIGCCPVQFFMIQTAHISITILSQFCSQIKLKTSYNWEHLVEVSKMNADFHVRSVTGECFSWEYFIAPVIRRSNDKSYCTCSVLVVNQKLLLSKFQGKKMLFTA